MEEDEDEDEGMKAGQSDETSDLERIRQERELQRRKKVMELKNFSFNLESDLKEEYEKIVAAEEDYEEPLEDLTEAQLDEWIGRVLLPDDPNADINRVEYSFMARQYVNLMKNKSEHLIYHMEGNCVHVETPDAAQQLERQELEAVWAERWAEMDEMDARRLAQQIEGRESMMGKREGEEKEEGEEGEGGEEGEEGEENKEEEKKEEEEKEEEEDAGHELSKMMSMNLALGQSKRDTVAFLPRKKLFNQFNFSDRAALTYDPVMRDISTQTIPAPMATMSGLVSQWIIYDEYQRDYNEQAMAKERERQAKMIVTRTREDRTIKKVVRQEDPIYKRIYEGLRILERMLNQNTYDYIAMDCQFYEDPSDKYRTDPLEGTLLPLWEFKYSEAKNMTVTDLIWNPAYYDLFGATFGTFDFCDPCPNGYLCVFTLKNPSFPEYLRQFDSGAMCLDFHPRKCYFVVVGLLNGGVVVQNVQTPTQDTPYRAHVSHFHTNLVWSVLWCDDARDRHPGFFSAGADGRICKWMLVETELHYTPIITLFLDKEETQVDRFSFRIRAMLTCLTFHPTKFEIFYVGTAVGKIFKCSISYASTYLHYIEAHRCAVHRIAFNRYNPEIFVTCSGDWRVKIWEDNRPEPYFCYNLEAPVFDVEWAPYSSTVLAAYTSTGKVFIYDLNINKYDPICVQIVICTEDNIGTRVVFNKKIPVILVGDTRGCVTALKVSPNLRIKPKPPKKGEVYDPLELEKSKLEKILAYVREPIILEEEPDIEKEIPKERKDF